MGLSPRVLSLLGLLPLVAGCIKQSVEHHASAAPVSTTLTPSLTANPAMPPTVPTLRQVAARSERRAGVALTTLHFAEAKYREVAAAQFDSLTPENQMKWDTVEPDPGRFVFTAGDELVDFATSNRMRVRGHTLVWHSQLPAWVKSLHGDALHAAMISHVRGTASHFRGRIAQWDVVNEALDDGGEPRAKSPFTPLGPHYIDDAFRAAHEANPDALLFYNDYEIEGPGSPKTEAAFGLVKRLKADGVPIHGVGFQMHVEPRHWPTAPQIRDNLERFAALGLLVEITELDVPVGELTGNASEKLEEQKRLTHDIVAACLQVKACSGITFRGVSDKHSWLNMPQFAALRGRGPHLPLPFDDHYAPKPMYFGARDAFLEHR